MAFFKYLEVKISFFYRIYTGKNGFKSRIYASVNQLTLLYTNSN